MKIKKPIYYFLYISLCVLCVYFKMWLWLIGLILLGVIVASLWFIGLFIEAGVRNKFPEDFVSQIGWVISYFETKGFQHVTNRNGGTDNPESVLVRNGKEEIIVRLNAPLLSSVPYTITIISSDKAKEWDFREDADRGKVYKELDCFFENILEPDSYKWKDGN